MRQAALLAAGAGCLALTGCGGAHPAAAGSRAVTGDWRQVATPADRARLRAWRDAWMQALAKAQASGEGAAIAAQGALFEPDRELPGPVPPPGDYRCRIFKLGAKAPGMRDVVAYPPFACRIDLEGERSSFYKIGGSQRPVGLVFDDTAVRATFLGTMVLGDETHAMDYGRDASRDMAGFVERVGERRWRVALPFPRFESTLDVVELLPAG